MNRHLGFLANEVDVCIRHGREAPTFAQYSFVPFSLFLPNKMYYLMVEITFQGLSVCQHGPTRFAIEAKQNTLYKSKIKFGPVGEAIHR